MRPSKVALSAALFALALAAASAQTRAPTNRPPSVTLAASADRLVLAEGCGDTLPACTATATTLQLLARATDPDGNRLLYSYTTTGGKLSGDGEKATLDLTGTPPGTYTVTVEVRDGRGGVASDTATVTLERCICSQPLMPLPSCPTVTVSCPDESEVGKPVTFTAAVSGGDPNVTPTFTWAVSAGVISGQGTNSITVDRTGVVAGVTVTATVDVGGYDRSCQTSNSCTLNVCNLKPQPRKVDEYGPVPPGDERERLNNLFVELQNDPTAQGYLICYGGRRGRAGEARRRCERARNYLVQTRGIEASRVATVEGGLREQPTTEFWMVPSGATPPTAGPAGVPPS